MDRLANEEGLTVELGTATNTTIGIGTATIEIVPDFTKFDILMAQRTRALTAAEPLAEEAGTRWISDIAFENRPTGDGRFMVKDSLGWREPPLTLMAMIETPEMGGHAGAQVAGRMDTFAKDAEFDMDGTALKDGAIAVRSSGEFDTSGERGAETARMVQDETMRGISVDLAVLEWAFRDPETGAIIDPEDATDDEWERAFMGEFEFAVMKGEIMAATCCPTPAFADARIAILASGWLRPNVWTANAEAAERYGVKEGQVMTTLTSSMHVAKEPVTASAKAHPVAKRDAAPLALPNEWLHRPEAAGPCAMTYEDNGAVYGHIALWDTCHTGFLNGDFAQCIRAPRSVTEYAHFHHGDHLTAEGELTPIGKLTYDTGHANLSAGRVAARRHYDETGAVGAFIRASNGEHGIWVSGGLRSDLTPEGVRDLRACPPSGDWRSFERNLELIACLSVVVPGFPVARSQLALSAAANGQIEVTALILTGLLASSEVRDFEHEGASLAALIAGEEALDALIQDER